MVHTEEDNRGGEGCNDGRVAALLHNSIDDGNGETAKDSGESTHADIGDMGLCVAVADVLEAEGAVIAYEPTGETKEEFCKRRVDVEVVLSCNIIRSKLAEVYFVEAGHGVRECGHGIHVSLAHLHDLVWVVDFVET